MGLKENVIIGKLIPAGAGISAYREMANIASQVGHRATRTEIKLFSTVHVKDLQKQADEMAKELRLLDNTIQAANWATDLG